MKNFLTSAGALALITLSLHTATANELAEKNQALESIKATVAERETKLEDSENTLKAQSETLRCLSKLLEAYNSCETEHTLRSPEHRQCLSVAKDNHAGCAS